uniref:Uncharacterized protein n=1 Tax=Anguilla anguilla TaxID=7936 RepID=A0A0E9PR44_ANGAN
MPFQKEEPNLNSRQEAHCETMPLLKTNGAWLSNHSPYPGCLFSFRRLMCGYIKAFRLSVPCSPSYTNWC